ncbi:MAG TPA: hypothetical protein VEG30_19045 [Terriglobales bacterium]|nr:hypothetical protein [Terriglobales bacterium]
MSCLRLLILLLLSAASFAAVESSSPLTADEIMARVAANQDRAEDLRKNYIYKQHVHVVTHKTNGKLMREETTDYTVIPIPDGARKDLQLLTGRYLHKGKYQDFSGEPRPDADSIDAELVDSFRGDLTGDIRRRPDHQHGVHIILDEDTHTKDGIGGDLFPLTTAQQKKYEFRLVGEQMFQGREAYHIAFGPKNKHEIDWAGEAYIDRQEFQPMLVFTKLSRQIPFPVRTVLGIDLPGVGFSVQYKRQEDGAWFPSSFGTEFHLEVLHFLKRDISLSLDNHDFQHTHVDTKIEYGGGLR